MAVSNITRNLRDGELTIKDGTGTPKSLTLTLDNGDLSWDETDSTLEIKDRGVLSHTRPGDQMSCPLSFSAKWVQLIAASTSGGSTYMLYEMVDNLNSTFVSVASTGWQFALKYVFQVVDPAGANNETITFNKVHKTTLKCSEGDETNTISFSGVDFEQRPTITRA
jgi:hypothetical protein